MRNRCRAFSLVEMLIGLTVFSLLLGGAVAALNKSFAIWQSTASRQAAEHNLFRAQAALERELTLTAPDVVRVAPAGSENPSNGDALWFLSFVDPDTGEPVLHDLGDSGAAGEPKWQRNILYYCVRPANHDVHTGYSCGQIDDGEGYDEVCPHKVFIRKVIDNEDDDDGNEILLTDVGPHIEEPDGLDVSALGGDGIDEVRVVSPALLKFQAAVSDASVRVTLKACATEQARKDVQVGQAELGASPYTRERVFATYPKNASGVDY